MSLNQNDNENIGNKLEDFELLSSLGEGGCGMVIKVRSLINQKIYAMKIINLEKNEENKEYFISEIEMLKKLNHQNIVKYYTSFQKENQIYIIMEYLEYGDLNDYINLLLNLNEQNYDIINDKRGEIIHIFLQCIKALKYLKDSKIIHRDIKPENIFISKKEGIKIGDFGVAAILKDINKTNTTIINSKLKKNEYTVVGTEDFMSPEVMKGQQYNEKADIYSMGLIFYKIYFLKDYREKEWKIKDDRINITFIRESKPVEIQDPLIDFIFSMIEEDYNKRPDINILSEQIHKIYYNYFLNKNTSIFYSVIRCLGHFPYLKYFFRKNYNPENEKYSYYFYKCIINQDNWDEALIFFKQKFYEDNDYSFFEFNKEIKPYLLLNFILDKMQNEFFKEVDKNEKITISKNKYDLNLTENFKKVFSQNFKTIIGKNFSSVLALFYQCKDCKNIFNNYSSFFSLSFDLDLYLRKHPNQLDNINIEDLFKYQNDITLISPNIFKFHCLKCKKECIHKEKKIFFFLPYCLIINLECQEENNVGKINFPEELDLSSIGKGLSKESTKKYFLIGVIKNINGHYICIIHDYEKESKWYLYDYNKINELHSYKDHKQGNVEMLFYCSQEKNKMSSNILV